jgi:hypothetical protein
LNGPFDSGDGCERCNVVHKFEVLLLTLCNEFGRPRELYVVEVHPTRAENLNEVMSDLANLCQISAHFVIQLRKNIGDVQNHCSTSSSDTICVDCGNKRLRNVHATGGFETIVSAERSLLSQHL